VGGLEPVAEPGSDASAPEQHDAGSWRDRPQDQDRVLRLLRELEEWFEYTGKERYVPETPLEEVDSAEDVKQYMLRHGPSRQTGFGCRSGPDSPLWDRISLHRLRTRGHRHWFAVVRSLDMQHRLLVLKIPPRSFACDADKWEHARRQMTYQDDRHGVFAPGVRVRVRQFLDQLPEGDQEFMRQAVEGGFPMPLTYAPAPFWRKGNYASYNEHADKAQADLERQVQAGFVEGPLHYRPWIVNPQGGVWLPEKGKWRTVHDCTKSGLNAAIAPQECRYDMLDDVLREQQEDCWMVGWDLKDAFFNLPRLQEHCDYLGLEDAGGNFYRHRFAVFGASDSPAFQQRYVRILMEHLNRLGASGAGDWPNTTLTGVFVDDGHGVQPASLTLPEAEREFDAQMQYFASIGLIDSPAKRVWPTKDKSYVGCHINSTTQVVQPERRKVEKYTAAVRALLSGLGDKAELVVGRREFTSVVGKLQHVAPLVRGGQGLLTRAYRDRDMLVDSRLDPTLSSAWTPDVDIRVQRQTLQDLETFISLLPDSRRRYYLDSPLVDERGFWRGETSTSHGRMDSTSATDLGVQVYTTDANAEGGGGHFQHERIQKLYPPHECHPNKSSNFRELDMGLVGLHQWGERWAGQRVLWRTDNTTAVSVVNRQGTMAPDLEPLSKQIEQFCREHDIDLAAGHIAGVLNVLADRLSRYRWNVDHSNWMLHPPVFTALCERLRILFTLDGSADPLGTNSQLPRFCSELDSLLDADLRGERLYCNPDFDMIDAVLRHFLACQRDAPDTTSGTFVLPRWLTKSWWSLLRGARVVAFYPEGSDLFTSPDWQSAQTPGHMPSSRVFRGPTRWPVLMVHFPACLPRRGSRGAPLRTAGELGATAAQLRGMLRLSGDPVVDEHGLRSVPPLPLFPV